jgi:hypothetical protein
MIEEFEMVVFKSSSKTQRKPHYIILLLCTMSLLLAAHIAIIVLLALSYLLILATNYIHWVLAYVEPVVSGKDVEITWLWRVAGWLWIRVRASVIDATAFYHRQSWLYVMDV